jgi:type IV secretory pathway VirB10-like protein
MNPKILLAFVGGAAVAGGLAIFLSRGPAPVPTPEPASQEAAVVVERPVESSAADVAAGMEAVRPRPVETARREMRLPKPAPVVVKNARVAAPVKNAAEAAPVAAAQQDSGSGIILPPFNSNPGEPPKPVREEPKRAEIMKPDTVAKPVQRTPETVTIPAGTSVSVRMNSTINSEKNIAGDSFTATLESPLVIDDIVLAERGAKVDGKVVEVDRSGRVKGTARLTLALTRIQLSDGQNVELKTDAWERVAEKSTKSDAAKVGIMTGIGAAIGAIAGGGKGAAVGAASGGATGTGVVLATRGKAAQIDVETKIPFRLSTPLTVTEKIN